MTIFSGKFFHLCKTRKRGELLLATMSIGVGCPYRGFLFIHDVRYHQVRAHL